MSASAARLTRRICGCLLVFCLFSVAVLTGCPPNRPGGSDNSDDGSDITGNPDGPGENPDGPDGNPDGPDGPGGDATNAPPTANAGVDQVVNAGASVTLDGSGSSDPDGDAISFSWRQTLGPPVSLSEASSPVATFTAPDTGGTLGFELTVSDGQSSSVGRVGVGVQSTLEPTVLVEDRRQRSVGEDPAVAGNFPRDWLIADAGAGLTPPPADDLELPEFEERFEKAQILPVVQEDLAPGATRTVSLNIAGPSGVGALVQWIGTTSPLTVAIALDGTTLVTGKTYQLGHDRGGSYVSAQTTAGGVATFSVTNTSSVAVIVRITFGANQL